LSVLLDIPELEIRNALSTHSVSAKSGLVCIDRKGASLLSNKIDMLSQDFTDTIFPSEPDPVTLLRLGQSEKNIAHAFAQAEQDRALLLIDEVDSFLQDRRGAQRSWEVSQVNEMLTRMEAFSGVFIAFTNLMAGLDQAALRRFDLKVKFDFLKAKQAQELLWRYCITLGLPRRKENVWSY
jgi:transitional endoplasmic reticulum ATPase